MFALICDQEEKGNMRLDRAAGTVLCRNATYATTIICNFWTYWQYNFANVHTYLCDVYFLLTIVVLFVGKFYLVVMLCAFLCICSMFASVSSMKVVS